jgi:putative membrane protein
MNYGEPAYYMIGMHAIWWLFWPLAIGALLFIARGRGASGDADDPRDVLRRRLATGEIQADEYEQRIALLNRDS